MIENFSLKDFNTFHIDVKARYFQEVATIEELKKTLLWAQQNNLPFFILGGGSNIVFTQNFEGVVIANRIKGIEEKIIDDNHVLMRVNAGENWHDFVLYCVEKNYGGIENLSLIPGNVGTGPIQNIGAYGVELKNVFVSCNVLDLSDDTIKSLTKEECKFGYRESIFKNEARGKYIILSVDLLLTRKEHKISTSYGAIQSELEKRNITHPTLQQISDVVVDIRRSKLPNPDEVGNCGSFFKNPIISEIQFKKLKQEHPDIPHYEAVDGVKIPAAWLIEKSGWKGKVVGNVGCHPKQALVLINATGKATGEEVFQFSEKIIQSVQENFGITLEREVNLL